MHPYVIEQLVEERQQALSRLAQVDANARAARRQARDAGWRRAVGRGLVAAAVAVGVPRSQRQAKQRQVSTTLGFETRGGRWSRPAPASAACAPAPTPSGSC